MSYYAIYDNEGYDGKKLDIQFTQAQISTFTLDELKELSTFARGSRKYSSRVIALSWDARVNRVNADTQDWLLDIIAMKEDDPARILAKLSPARVDVVYQIPGTNEVAWIDGSPSTYSPKVYRGEKTPLENCHTSVDGVIDAQRKAVLIDEFYRTDTETESTLSPIVSVCGATSRPTPMKGPNLEPMSIPVDSRVSNAHSPSSVKKEKESERVDDRDQSLHIVSRDRICSYLETSPETSHLVDVLVSYDEGVGCDFFEEALPNGHVKLSQVRHLDQPMVESVKTVSSDQVSRVIVDFYKVEKDKMLSALPLNSREVNRHTVVPKTSFGVSMGDVERIAHLYFGRDQIRHCVRPFAATNCSVTVRGKDFYLEFAYHGAAKARAKYGPFSVGNVDYRDDTYLLLAVVQSMESFFSVRRTRPVPIFIHHNNFINYGNCYRCFGKVFKTSYPWYVCVKCQKPRATCDLVYEDMVLVRFPPFAMAKTIFVSQKYEGCDSSYFLNLRHFGSVTDARDYTRLLRLCADFVQRCRSYSLLWCLSCPGSTYRQLISDLQRMCRVEVLWDDGSFEYGRFPGKFPHKGLAPDVITWLAKVSVPPLSVKDSSLVVWAMENDLSANLCGLLSSVTFEKPGLNVHHFEPRGFAETPGWRQPETVASSPMYVKD